MSKLKKVLDENPKLKRRILYCFWFGQMFILSLITNFYLDSSQRETYGSMIIIYGSVCIFGIAMTCVDLEDKRSDKVLKNTIILGVLFVGLLCVATFFLLLVDFGYSDLHIGRNLGFPFIMFTASWIYFLVRVVRHHKSPSPPNEEQNPET